MKIASFVFRRGVLIWLFFASFGNKIRFFVNKVPVSIKKTPILCKRLKCSKTDSVIKLVAINKTPCMILLFDFLVRLLLVWVSVFCVCFPQTRSARDMAVWTRRVFGGVGVAGLVFWLSRPDEWGFCKGGFDSDRLERISKDIIFQYMKKDSGKTLQQFWSEHPETIDHSKKMLETYLAAIYVTFPCSGSRFFGRHENIHPQFPYFNYQPFFSTEELLFAKEKGLLKEEAIKRQMKYMGNLNNHLWYWLMPALHEQLQTVFPGFEYPNAVFRSFENYGWIKVDIHVLAKDPHRYGRLRNLVWYIQKYYSNDQKFYDEFLATHPDVLQAYKQAAIHYLAKHDDTTNLPFWVIWYLQNKNKNKKE